MKKSEAEYSAELNILRKENIRLQKRVTFLEKKIDKIDDKWRQALLDFIKEVNEPALSEPSITYSDDYLASLEDKLKNQKPSFKGAAVLMDEARSEYMKVYREKHQESVQDSVSNLSESAKERLERKARELNASKETKTE